MSRYRGPKIRILKRLGSLPGFGLSINQKFKQLPLNINIKNGKTKKKKKSSDYFTVRLQEKQKLRYHYGLTEKNLTQYVIKARKKKTPTGKTLLNILEMRLDNIIFRIGFAPTLASARQLITHGHILLNEKRINIPSYQCNINDLITLSDSITTKKKFAKISQLPKTFFLSLDTNNLIGKVQKYASRQDVGLNINELLVIEYYSRAL
uniref:Small ribosomal subunit protein uS4c n=1 Tax=Flabellia petiolata TaxID=189428 RepID=A0A386AXA1_9CHLO|nr:ribosomal protein S4 [Flabellia petiolata]